MSDSADRSPYEGRRVLVVGASGFIGRWVARLLTTAGARLWLTARNPAIAKTTWREYAVEGELLPFDLGATAELPPLLRAVRPAVVFNLAGYGVGPDERDPQIAEAVNHRWVERLAAELSRDRDATWPGQALVHSGSALEYGAVGGDLQEDGATNPTTLYGRTKLAGTMALRAAAELPSVTARLFTVYGPGERPGRLLPSLIAAARQGRRLPLTAGLQRRDFTYVEEVAEGLLRLGLAVPAAAGETFNLATGQLTSVREFALEAASELGLDAARLGFGEVPTREEEMQHAPVNVARIERRIGWRPTKSIEEGIRRTIDFAPTASLP